MSEILTKTGDTKARSGVFIRPSSQEERVKLVDFLEAEGFSYQPHDGIMDREDVLASDLPVVADIKNKIIRRMGNITVAACAVSQKILCSEEEFYSLYNRD